MIKTIYRSHVCMYGRQQLRSMASGTLLVPRARTATGQRSFATTPSMDQEHGTVCQPILEHQIRPSAPSNVISRPTCFSSSLRCCWQVGSAPFVRRRCDCSESSTPFTNIRTYLLTYLLNAWSHQLPRTASSSAKDAFVFEPSQAPSDFSFQRAL